MKNISGLLFAAGFDFGGGLGGPSQKYAHSGFGPEFGANGTAGGACTQLLVAIFEVIRVGICVVGTASVKANERWGRRCLLRDLSSIYERLLV